MLKIYVPTQSYEIGKHSEVFNKFISIIFLILVSLKMHAFVFHIIIIIIISNGYRKSGLCM